MPRKAILLILLLIAVEAFGWWWMHPKLAGAEDPVLTWTPPALPENPPGPEDQNALIERPEIYVKSAPMLRCSNGKVFTKNFADGSSLFIAYFEWNAEDTGSVLEAFRHMPEDCLGSIGLELVQKAPPIRYSIDQEPLVFDHTILKDPKSAKPIMGLGASQSNIATDTSFGSKVHAFKSVWVSGIKSAYARESFMGEETTDLRSIRLKSALSRYRPAHARVVQGTAHGFISGEAAFEAFKDLVLKDLKFE